MAIQFIIYSKATGRVRRVFVESPPPADPIAYAASVRIADGEAIITYGLTDQEKLLKGAEESAVDWQGIVTAATGLAPTNDRYVAIDKAGNIIKSLLADPSCGDAIEGCQLIQHNDADDKWTYDVATATLVAPIYEVKQPTPEKLALVQARLAALDPAQLPDAQAALIAEPVTK